MPLPLTWLWAGEKKIPPKKNLTEKKTLSKKKTNKKKLWEQNIKRASPKRKKNLKKIPSRASPQRLGVLVLDANPLLDEAGEQVQEVDPFLGVHREPVPLVLGIINNKQYYYFEEKKYIYYYCFEYFHFRII